MTKKEQAALTDRVNQLEAGMQCSRSGHEWVFDSGRFVYHTGFWADLFLSGRARKVRFEAHRRCARCGCTFVKQISARGKGMKQLAEFV